MTTDQAAVEALMQSAEAYSHTRNLPVHTVARKQLRAAIAAALAAVRERALEDAAAWVDARRNAFVAEHGHTDPDTGALEFGRGPHAEEKAEYAGELEEIAEGIRALKAKEEGK